MPRVSSRLPTGQEIAYVEDVSGVTQSLTTSDVAGTLSITLPLSSRPIWIVAEAWVDVTTAAAVTTTGIAALTVKDNQGSPVSICADFAPFESTDAAGFSVLRAMGRIAPNTPSRIYTCYFLRAGSSTFRANILNGSVGAAYRSYLTAMYR